MLQGQSRQETLPQYVIEQKGLDGNDTHLRKAMAYKIVQLLRRWERERRIERMGKAGAVVMWRLDKMRSEERRVGKECCR